MFEGYKSYLVAIAIVAVTFAWQLNYLDDNTANTLFILLGAGGLATMSAKVNRIDKKLLLIFAFLLLPTVISAQPQTGSNQRFAWDQSAPTLTDAQSYVYKYYPDASTAGVAFSNVVCSGSASPFTCSVLIPAFTPGNHSITLTASNAAGESAQSSPFAFVFVVTPSVPSNIRIISGTQ